MTPPNTDAIVQRVWNYCNVLRDDGVSYGDYLEQLTYLLFLKMDHERVQLLNESSSIPPEYNWDSLRMLEGAELEDRYRTVLAELGKQRGLIGAIFRKAQNKIQDPAKLRRLIDLIDGETWTGMGVDVKSTIYEGLLEKHAQDVKSGAGQYFTPRPLIKAIVEVMRPEPGMTIMDPAAGTGGFLVAAYNYILEHYDLDREQLRFLQNEALHGWEIVNETARLCIMNLYLNGIGHDLDRTPIHVADSLAQHPGQYFDMVLTNPPFGKKSSVTYVTDEGEIRREAQTIVRDDFWVSTSNKQLNFVQHVFSILKQHGRAAVVVPDNVLFEGGAGEVVRRRLLQQADVHTLLRLPTGVFYRPGVKANVLFFDRKPARKEPWTKELWIYDLRTNKHFTLKQNPLTYEDLRDFIACYNPENRHARKPTWDPAKNPQGRWRVFTYEELMARDKVNLDIFWLQDESLEETSDLPDPDVLAEEIVQDLEAVLEQIKSVAHLNNSE